MMDDMYKAKQEGADIVEVMLDCVKNFRPQQDLEVIFKNKPLPVIIVCRYVNMPFVSWIFSFSLL